MLAEEKIMLHSLTVDEKVQSRDVRSGRADARRLRRTLSPRRGSPEGEPASWNSSVPLLITGLPRPRTRPGSRAGASCSTRA